jgi:hypothetical protein
MVSLVHSGTRGRGRGSLPDRYPSDVPALINVEGNFSLADAFWSAELARKAPSDAEPLLAAYRDDPAAWLGGTTDPCEIECARAILAFQPASTLQATAASVLAVTAAPTLEPLAASTRAAGSDTATAWGSAGAVSRRGRRRQVPGGVCSKSRARKYAVILAGAETKAARRRPVTRTRGRPRGAR